MVMWKFIIVCDILISFSSLKADVDVQSLIGLIVELFLVWENKYMFFLEYFLIYNSLLQVAFSQTRK